MLNIDKMKETLPGILEVIYFKKTKLNFDMLLFENLLYFRIDSNAKNLYFVY